MRNIILLFLLFLWGCDSCYQKNATSLKIGVNANFPPFEFMDDKGNMAGFDIDLAHALSAHLKKPIELKEFDFDALILALNKEQIDMIISGLSITESRQKEITMIPYLNEPLTEISLLFWQQTPQINNWEDLKILLQQHHGVINVQSGHYLEDFLRKEDIPLKTLIGPPEQILDIKYHKSLAAAVDVVVGEKLSKDHPGLKNIVLPLPKDKWDLGYGIGIKKSRIDLIKTISDAVSKLNNDGTIRSLSTKWFKL